jgi:hypothetical protein
MTENESHTPAKTATKPTLADYQEAAASIWDAMPHGQEALIGLLADAPHYHAELNCIADLFDRVQKHLPLPRSGGAATPEADPTFIPDLVNEARAELQKLVCLHADGLDGKAPLAALGRVLDAIEAQAGGES